MPKDPSRSAGIEFLVGADLEEASGDLLAPAPGPWRGRRRVLIGAGTAGLLVLLVVRGASGGEGPSPTNARALTAAPSTVGVEPQMPSPATAAPRTSFVVLGGPRIAVRHDTATVIYRMPGADVLPAPGPACGVHVGCRTTGALPAEVLAALRSRFTGIVVDSATTELTGSAGHGLRLRSRTIVAQATPQTIIVTISPIQPQDRSLVVSAAAGSGSSTTATVAARPWTVTVSVHNPRTREADPSTADELAADARLLASR